MLAGFLCKLRKREGRGKIFVSLWFICLHIWGEHLSVKAVSVKKNTYYSAIVLYHIYDMTDITTVEDFSYSTMYRWQPRYDMFLYVTGFRFYVHASNSLCVVWLWGNARAEKGIPCENSFFPLVPFHCGILTFPFFPRPHANSKKNALASAPVHMRGI